ncbi:MAG: tetraacyldisaccharide 4'-kinase [Betaproteobacteria bacterium]
MRFADRLVAAWYAPRVTALPALLAPLSWVFGAAAAARRGLYRAGVLAAVRLPVPVIVVGNITAGGAGKTPLVLALVAALSERGWRPGIVSRGYGGSNVLPRAVAPGDDSEVVGDEPLLLAASGHPVWIGRRRADAAQALVAAHPECNVIVADDGLQHYALARSVEIAVIDAARGVGNGLLLPAGPLREPRARLDTVDAIVRLVAWGAPLAAMAGRESAATLEPLPWRNVARPDAVADPAAWRAGEVHAIAGIGNPQRFFDLVRALGVAPVCHAFADHHRYTPADIAFPGATAILMTEKDAVKCAGFADARCWCLPVRARIDPLQVDLIEDKLRGFQAA